ncbi:zinc ribbon domain-containing protein [Pseudidiomarina halophila]|uniref:Zinc ribbon domain-containing protein n=1 Tax=Pseudidiomarina halophila TaxID=1449799 RepID=A0A432XVZ6_9GAMM|nr:zinc ribbon domain-containing protein [Pseudidiomarina halophila]RUO52784.1 zinc ribbon domain-containing protein [Pseudidiomarina halophila]
MAIEKCPKCEDQVLDNKYSCPACGFVKPDKPEQQKHPKKEQITTENTSKSLQIQGVVSVVLFIVGILWFYLTADEYQQRGQLNIIALLMFVIGFIWYVVTRFRIWRQHKSG